MTIRSIATALVMAWLLMPDAPASAQQAKCLAGKTKCMAKKAAGLLKCEALAETPGKPADPNAKDCVTKVKVKFDGGLEPTKGCFEKLERKDPNDCLTVDDTGAAETAVDTCVAALVTAIDPPPLDQTKCGAGKKKCVSKYLAALLKCRTLAQTPGKPTDPNTKGCVDKAEAKYTGADDPTKGCFAKLEAKDPNDCQFTNDSATLRGLAADCVDDLVAVVTGMASTSTTLGTTTSTIVGTTTTTPTSTTTSTIPTTDLCPLLSRCGAGCCGQTEACCGSPGARVCCAEGQACIGGTCTDGPACGLGGTTSCVLPLTCQGGRCVTPCGPITCRPDLGEICCSSSSLNGICCDGDSQVCSSTQTSCVTEVCPQGQVYVPKIAGCCQNQNVCGTYGDGVPADCCIFGVERCDPTTVSCVPR